MGINYIKLPPHDPNLNEAESICDRAHAAGRANLIATNRPGSHMALAVGHACHMKLRMANGARRGYKTPYEILKGHR